MPYRNVDFADPTGKPDFIDTANLVKQHASTLALQPNFRTASERLPFARDRCDDDSWQVLIHVVGGDDQRRARLLYFRADSRIKVDPLKGKSQRYPNTFLTSV